MTFKNTGKITEIKIAPGLPKDSKPNSRILFQSSKPSKTVHKVVPSFSNPQPQSIASSKIASSLNDLRVSDSSGIGSSSNIGSSKPFGSSNAVTNLKMDAPKSNASLYGSITSLSESQQKIAAAASKRKPPPPPTKNVPRCEALYVSYMFETSILLY